MFAESLTVRILADSAGFRADLDSVLSLLNRLRENVKSVAEGGAAMAGSFSQLSRAVAPLQQISKLLSTIHQQVRSISQTPLTINVDLALAALAHLSAMIDMVAAKLSALSSIGAPPGAGPRGAGPGVPPSGFGPSVAGSYPGLPTKLASASFAAPGPGATGETRSPSTLSSAATTNNFGGITIQVRETADVNALVRDLRLQGIHLRNRRG